MTDHKVEDLKGRAKEAAGDLTNNDDMKREGKMDRASSSIKDKADDVKDKVEDAVDKVKEKLRNND
jgi:uncharacterized protein YjbJ (UPF0337 family)